MAGFNSDAGSLRSGDTFTGRLARAATRVHQIRLVLTALVLVLMSVNLNAQSGEGSLTGRVIESGTERALEGAIVTVEGTPLRDYTDETGRFVINGIPTGQYEVTVSYVGLQPASGSISVSSGGRATYNPQLESLQGVESITVRASRTGADRAINQQRTASGIINVISEEQFGSLVDAKIGQALQRLRSCIPRLSTIDYNWENFSTPN